MPFTAKITDWEGRSWIESIPGTKYRIDKYGVYFTNDKGCLVRQFDLEEIDVNTIEGTD